MELSAAKNGIGAAGGLVAEPQPGRHAGRLGLPGAVRFCLACCPGNSAAARTSTCRLQLNRVRASRLTVLLPAHAAGGLSVARSSASLVTRHAAPAAQQPKQVMMVKLVLFPCGFEQKSN